jgi:hypothetical protein
MPHLPPHNSLTQQDITKHYYASGMNKAALLAAHLGAATLHRRDSDEFPAYDSESGAYTLEVEIAALGTALPTGAGVHTAPFMVGSSVEGEPTKDHRTSKPQVRILAPSLKRSYRGLMRSHWPSSRAASRSGRGCL